MERPDLRAFRALLVLRVLREMMELPELLVRKVQLETMALQVLLDLRVLPVHKVRKDLPGMTVQPGHKVLSAHKDHRVRQPPMTNHSPLIPHPMHFQFPEVTRLTL